MRLWHSNMKTGTDFMVFHICLMKQGTITELNGPWDSFFPDDFFPIFEEGDAEMTIVDEDNKEIVYRLLSFGLFDRGVMVPHQKKECHNSMVTTKRVWELGIQHATNEATKLGDFHLHKGRQVFPVADLNAGLNKDAVFVDTFNKEPYWDPFYVLLLVKDAPLQKELLLKFQASCLLGMTVGTVFFWNLLKFIVPSLYKGRDRGGLLCGATLWN